MNGTSSLIAEETEEMATRKLRKICSKKLHMVTFHIKVDGQSLKCNKSFPTEKGRMMWISRLPEKGQRFKIYDCSLAGLEFVKLQKVWTA